MQDVLVLALLYTFHCAHIAAQAAKWGIDLSKGFTPNPATTAYTGQVVHGNCDALMIHNVNCLEFHKCMYDSHSHPSQ